MPQQKQVLDRLTNAYPQLSPQLRHAAKSVLEAPEEVAMRSMRGFAAQFGIAPTTMVRLAKAAGFKSYDAFRRPFQEAIRGGSGFAGRAEWLQGLAASGDTGEIVSGMASAVLANVETAFRGADASVLAAAADALLSARRVHVVGVGGLHGPATYFAYVARMMLPDVRLAAPAMATIVDELATMTAKDVMVIGGVDPYARETVRAADVAVERDCPIVAVTDSRASPLAQRATYLLLVPTASPQFFPSQSAVVAMLETVIAVIVSRGDKALIKHIEAVDRFRTEKGIYWRDGR